MRSKFIALVLIIGGVFVLQSVFKKNNLTFEDYANQVVQKCKGENPQRCYDQEIPKLTSIMRMEDAFEVLKLVQKKDGNYWFCHEGAHNLSEKEYEKDPSKWQDVVARCPSGVCSNGCIHGAIQRHFISESLNKVQLEEVMPVLEKLCEVRPGWNPTPHERSSCYHEIGHLSHYLTAADVNTSKKICDRVALKKDGRNYLQTCYEGIFMQLFEPREPEDFALIYNIIPNKEELAVCDKYTSGIEKGACWKIGWRGKEKAFCNRWEGELRNACFREAWVINDQKIETPEGILAYCTYSVDPAEKRKCYNKLFYALMAKFEFDVERMKSICASFSSQDIQGQCLANTASRLIETDHGLVDNALAVCSFATKYGVAEECYNELAYYAAFAFRPGSEEQSKLCRGIPEPWKNKCLKL